MERRRAAGRPRLRIRLRSHQRRHHLQPAKWHGEVQRTPTRPVRFDRIGTVRQKSTRRHSVVLERGEL